MENQKTTKVFLQTDTLTLINDDILVTNAIADSSIDLIVTSPPYNVGIQYESSKDDTWSHKLYKTVHV